MRLLAKLAIVPALLRWLLGQRVWAVAALTWKAAFRFRLFWVLTTLLLGSVVVLPLMLKDDGTARGFIQIMLTYTLSVITALLGISTLWLACGTLARDIEDCSMQMVVVKPIARWQVWLGKFTGIMLLNAALLAVAGASVFTLLKWRTTQMERALARAEQSNDRRLAAHLAGQLSILRNEIFVARASLREPELDVSGEVERQFQRVPNRESLTPEQREQTREQLRQRVLAFNQVVYPNHYRTWAIDLGLQKHLLGERPLYLRVKFNVAQTNASGTYLGLWTVGPYNSPLAQSHPQSLSADTFHEVGVMGGGKLLDERGRLVVNFINQNDTSLIFPLNEGLEVLYREGGFGLNFARGLAVVFCWLGLLAAIGLAAASLMSFPVAAFFSLSLLVVALSSGTLAGVVSEGTVTGRDHETGAGGNPVDLVLVPVFKILLEVVKLAQDFSPVESLSTGRSITWGQLALAFGRIVLLLGGLFALAGMACFSQRELAATQPQS